MTIDLKDRLYTSSEVAEILGVSLRSVYRYLEEGKLDADIKTATGRHRFSKKNILDFLQPGGITKEIAEDTLVNKSRDSYDDVDVLDLPAINKVKKNQETEDDFDFDLDEDFFKTLNFDSSLDVGSKNDNQSKNSSGIKDGDYFDDDLEKLLKEFEEKESNGVYDNTLDSNSVVVNNSLNPDKDDSFDLDLDSFFKELEESDASVKSFERNDSKQISNTENKLTSEKDDFDFDLDFLDELFEKEEKELATEQTSNKSKLNEAGLSNQSTKEIEEEDSEDNWLERFRKAAQKNSSTENNATSNQGDSLKSSFFDNSNLDHFFSDSPKSSSLESVSSLAFGGSKEEEVSYTKVKEFYYVSSLNGLKEIAQNIDKVARKFDTDYAFTMNAGLSLHKPISPFTLIHVYVRNRDLELFEDYLNLTPVESASEASVCLMVPEDASVFEDAYELHGLYVVSNVQLRSDLIDKGLDKLAREI